MQRLLGYRNCKVRGRLEGKLAVVTGCNTGIGLETVGELARRGCTVIMACRDLSKTDIAKEKILAKYSNGAYKTFQLNSVELAQDYTEIVSSQLIPMALDLADFKSVVSFVAEFKKTYSKLDLLICNAGVMMCPYEVTVDGFEKQMGTNHLGHVLLTELLMNFLKASNEPRVIMVSSRAHLSHSLDLENFLLKEEDYTKTKAYANSKMANILYASHLANRDPGMPLLAFSLHPGLVRTELFRHFSNGLKKSINIAKPFTKSPWQGCQTTLYCCLAPKNELNNGSYYVDCKLGKCSIMATDLPKANQFIIATLKILKDVPSCKNFFVAE